MTTSYVENYNRMVLPGGLYYERLNAVNYNKEPWISKYPKLQNFFTESSNVPKRNPFHDNVIIRSTVFESRTDVKPDDFVYENLVYPDFRQERYRAKQCCYADINRWLEIHLLDEQVLNLMDLKFEELIENNK